MAVFGFCEPVRFYDALEFQADGSFVGVFSPRVELAPGWVFCEECGRPMERRSVWSPCCDYPYDCGDWVENDFCLRCDPV